MSSYDSNHLRIPTFHSKKARKNSKIVKFLVIIFATELQQGFRVRIKPIYQIEIKSAAIFF